MTDKKEKKTAPALKFCPNAAQPISSGLKACPSSVNMGLQKLRIPRAFILEDGNLAEKLQEEWKIKSDRYNCLEYFGYFY